jgi:hypothetical protein
MNDTSVAKAKVISTAISLDFNSMIDTPVVPLCGPYHATHDFFQSNFYAPLGIVSLKLSGVGDIANVITKSVLIAQTILDPMTTEFLNQVNAFENRSRIASSAT